MAVKKMGFEGLIYYGVAGSTAATQLTNTRDITETFEIEEGATTERGDGSAPPLETTAVTGRKYAIEWQMTYKSDDASLLAIIAAGVAGTPVAIRTKAAVGLLGYDGDVNISWKKGTPLNGEQTYDFKATPNAATRAPLLNV